MFSQFFDVCPCVACMCLCVSVCVFVNTFTRMNKCGSQKSVCVCVFLSPLSTLFLETQVLTASGSQRSASLTSQEMSEILLSPTYWYSRHCQISMRVGGFNEGAHGTRQALH